MTHKEPFLAVLEYILIPKYIKFLRQSPSPRRWTVGESKDSQSVETSANRKVAGKSAWLISIRNQALKGTQ